MTIKKCEVYKTSDGMVFQSESQAKLHDDQVTKVKSWVKKLIPKALGTDKNLSYSNGGGYIQSNPELVEEAWEFLEEAFYSTKKKEYSRAFLGRVLDDSDSPLYCLWTLLNCVDKESRIWGQPYFAINPKEGKQVCLGKSKP